MKQFYCKGDLVVSTKSIITISVLVDYCIRRFDLFSGQLPHALRLAAVWFPYQAITPLVVACVELIKQGIVCWLLSAFVEFQLDWLLLFSSWHLMKCCTLFLCCCLIDCCMFSWENVPPHYRCLVFVGTVITADAAATTSAVIVSTKGDIAAIVAVLFALPLMSLLLSYLCHNTHNTKHRIAVAVTPVDCCVWVT